MICNYCKEDKPIDQFPRYEKTKWKICALCLKERNKAYYQKNKDRYKERGRKWQDENKERIAKKRRDYYLENRERLKAYQKEWKKRNPDLHKRHKTKRRAIKMQVETEVWTHEEIAAQGTGLCPYCGKEIGFVYDSEIMQIDHMIPLSRGGSDLTENLEPVCCECNLKKHAKTKAEYILFLKDLL